MADPRPARDDHPAPRPSAATDDGAVLLPGGVANVGAVVRIGDTVRRPLGRHSATTQALLRHFEAVGFAGAPRFRGIDELGREILGFIPGDVAIPPFPAWAADEALLADVARLQRDAHEAASGFVVPPGVELPDPRLPPQSSGQLVCHLDVCLENVVVRDGRAVALLDWDMAAPADPLLDVAIATRHWVPMRDPADLDEARRGVDQGARLRRYLDAYGVAPADRERVLDLLAGFLQRGLDRMRQRAASGHPGFRAMWESGYPAANGRARAWLAAERARLLGGR
ncbi:MAG TPA: phosphotransferase [Candidatus Limnocylindrales bacterium]